MSLRRFVRLAIGIDGTFSATAIQRMPMTTSPNAAKTVPTSHDYVVKDIGLAEWGRKEIAIAETEMPGLMATRDEFGPRQPLRGARVAGSLHMHVQPALLT